MNLQKTMREIKYVLGCDPGLTGALVLLPLDGSGDPISCVMPILEEKKKVKGKWKTKHHYDLPSICKIFERASHIFIEQQQPMSKLVPERCRKCGEITGASPAQGANSIFSAAQGFGLLEGMAAMLGHLWGTPHELVDFRTWQPAMLSPGTGDTKARAKVAVHRLFPNFNLRRTPRCIKEHDGLADALLIAEFGRRKLGGSFTDSLNLPMTPETPTSAEFHLHRSVDEPYEATDEDIGF